MEKIQIHDKVFVPYMPYEQVSKIIDGVADKLNADLITITPKDRKLTFRYSCAFFMDQSCLPVN